MLAGCQHQIIKNVLATSEAILRVSHNAPTTVSRALVQLRCCTSLAMARTYEEALARLSSLQSNKAITALLETAATPGVAAAGRLEPGNPNAPAIPQTLAYLEGAGLTVADLHKLRCIHVAGTKGKGSVCAYLTSILTQPSARPVTGRVGTYTSPHLITVRERIQLDGQPISQQLFAQYFFEVWDALTASARAKAVKDGLNISDEDLEGPGTKPFFFLYLTIMAFYVFLRENVKTAVVECGIGGEYDSTNILPSEAVTATVITQLGLDHVGMLGATLPEIAWHKAGICKKDRPCFTRRLTGGDVQEGVMKVLRERAIAAGARLCEVADEDVQRAGVFNRTETTSSLAGSFQKYNQALALGAALEHMAQLSSSIQRPDETSTWLQKVPDFCKDGLMLARLRGRCETRRDDDATWYIDGAHTAESLHGAAEWFSDITSKTRDTQRVLVFNQQDRNVSKLLQDLLEGFQRHGKDVRFDLAVFTTNEMGGTGAGQAHSDTSVQATAMASMRSLSPQTKSVVSGSVDEAIRLVRGWAHIAQGQNHKTVVLVTGSLHLVSAVLRTMESEAEP